MHPLPPLFFNNIRIRIEQMNSENRRNIEGPMRKSENTATVGVLTYGSLSEGEVKRDWAGAEKHGRVPSW